MGSAPNHDELVKFMTSAIPSAGVRDIIKVQVSRIQPGERFTIPDLTRWARTMMRGQLMRLAAHYSAYSDFDDSVPSAAASQVAKKLLSRTRVRYSLHSLAPEMAITEVHPGAGSRAAVYTVGASHQPGSDPGESLIAALRAAQAACAYAGGSKSVRLRLTAAELEFAIEAVTAWRGVSG